jgi:hypothetical protein
VASEVSPEHRRRPEESGARLVPLERSENLRSKLPSSKHKEDLRDVKFSLRWLIKGPGDIPPNNRTGPVLEPCRCVMHHSNGLLRIERLTALKKLQCLSGSSQGKRQVTLGHQRTDRARETCFVPWVTLTDCDMWQGSGSRQNVR